jgi:hypothetical protein
MKILNNINMKDLNTVASSIDNLTDGTPCVKGLEKIPTPIVDLLDAGATAYSDSNATTNAGLILRFICRFIKPSTIIKMFAHKLTK